MLKECLKATKDLIFPPLCFVCGKKTAAALLCLECDSKIEFLNPPLCRGCSRPVGEDSFLCRGCKKKAYFYTKAMSITAYREPMVSMIHDFKYRHCDYLGDFLSSIMIKHLTKLGFRPHYYDCITSVPAHHLKLKERGYNQASLLAKPIANHFKITFRDDIIYETRYRPSQVKLKGSQRKENIKNCFGARNNLEYKNILLVDDIFTTGATVNTCAKILRKQGAENITVLTLSKAL